MDLPVLEWLLEDGVRWGLSWLIGFRQVSRSRNFGIGEKALGGRLGILLQALDGYIIEWFCLWARGPSIILICR
ncbi:hypothetical protein Hanom_Chr03g00193371 [Helianthus anomalus]